MQSGHALPSSSVTKQLGWKWKDELTGIDVVSRSTSRLQNRMLPRKREKLYFRTTMKAQIKPSNDAHLFTASLDFA